MSQELGAELKRLRELKGETVETVALSVGTTISSEDLEQMEQGIIPDPSPRVLYYLAQYFAVSYLDLLEMAGYVTRKGKLVRLCMRKSDGQG